MRSILCSSLCLLTLFGCAAQNRGDLYAVHESVGVGEAFPAELEFPPETQVGRGTDNRWVVASRKWPIGMHYEGATYLFDPDGRVIAKCYSGYRTEVFMLICWQHQSWQTEWEISAGCDKTLDDIQAVCSRLRIHYPDDAPPSAATLPEDLLETLRTQVDLSKNRFEFMHRPKRKNPLPFVLMREDWYAQRPDSQVLRIRIECTADACPVFAWPAGYAMMPFWLQ